MKAKTMRGILSVIISLAVALVIAQGGSIPVSAEANPTTIISGEYEYEFEEGGVGEDYVMDVVTISRYLGSDTSVTIPSSLDGYSVGGIGSCAFSSSKEITSVTIPNSITYISKDAFDVCKGLTNIMVGTGNTTYSSQNGVLYNKGMTSLILCPKGYTGSYTIPNSVTSIESNAFYRCTGLTSVAISDSVTSIKNDVFYGCTGLTQIVVDDSNNSYSSQEGVLFDKAVTLLLHCPAAKSGSYIIPNSVSNIEGAAFSGCKSLKSITLPSKMITLNRGSFFGCTGLTQILVDSNNSVYSSQNGVLFNKSMMSLIFCPAGYVGSYVIPNSVLSIQAGAFFGCTGLASVTIPDSITSIEINAFYGCTGLKSVNIPDSITSIMYGAFYGCTGLTQIIVDDGNTSYSSQNGILFNKDMTSLVLCPEGITGNCNIPNSVTSIKSGAFTGCMGLTSISIPGSVTSLDIFGISGCKGLTQILVDKSNTTYSSQDGVLFNKGMTSLLVCPAGYTGAYSIPNSVIHIEKNAFNGCTGLTDISIPNSVTSIGSNAFGNCTGLTSVVIPNSVTNIEMNTFIACTGMINVTIPESVTSINSGAFLLCKGLTTVSIPSGVKIISEYTFSMCTSLTSISIPAGVTSIEGYAFEGCTGLTGVSIPSSVTSIGMKAFANCTSLTNVSIPGAVTTIGTGAFSNCKSLTNAYFYGNAPRLASNPSMAATVFTGAPTFVVNYMSTCTGYTNPWYGYPTTIIEPIVTPTPTPTLIQPVVSYQTHIQDIGWQDYVGNGVTSGTSGQSKRLESIRIKLAGIDGGIEYRTHVQDIGWMEWTANDALSGTSGESKRLEAIEIRLTGAAADLYDVYYRVHAQDTGWLDWAKNGESSGTAGYGYRLEAIEIKLVAKGGAAPGAVTTPFKDLNAPKPVVANTVSYKTHVQDIGWQDYVSNGEMSGTSAQSKRLEAIQIKLENMAGGIEYSTHVQDVGWMGFVADDALSGTSGESKRLEAIQIRLTGAAAEQYGVYYCVHAENTGWLDWAKNGESAGTAGFGYRLEAIKIVLVPKGGAAPGATARAFVQG